ncbi:methyl-accepting chemotaxis protein [Clostridium beijerinckii]|uniref:methyl-accepting chemotaxis protein n=1 Tax=Clostridium beijerinckii TaxID=1520 RepID=UPI00242CD58C|nr:HAMP domain-containing methyl-accepting chemotaxis protein [Clostridium beijerinckii]MDG5853510.1 HAMP domain-containing methyl-accepting chemotaxis protein [Clostridium beijerinckii]
MKKIFYPGIKLMNKLKYSKKFLLILTIFLIPILAVLSFFVHQLNGDVKISENQIKGLNYINATTSFVRHVQQHRGLTSVLLSGNKSTEEQVIQKEQEIKNDIVAINKLDEDYGKELGTTNEWASIKIDWSSLEIKDNKSALSELTAKHTALISKILDFNGSIEDSSNLILQKQLDRYYLVDTIVNNLPMVTENLGLSRAVGSGVAGRKSITDDERFKLVYLTKAATINLDASIKGLDEVYKTKPEIKDKLSGEITGAFNNSKEIIDIVNKELLETNSITIDSTEYYNRATTAVDSIYTLIHGESTELMNILQQDNAYTVKIRFFVLVISVLTILSLIYLFVAFYYGIRGTIESIEESTHKISEGELNVHITHDVKDETVLIIDALNNMTKSFSQIIVASKNVSSDVIDSAENLAKTTEQTAKVANIITNSIQNVATKSEEQLQISEDASVAIEKMSKDIEYIAKNSNEVLKASRQADEFAEKGNISILETANMINNINNSVIESNSTIYALGKKSKSIGEIIDTITSIAEQTNLLALNASIEAARAGEGGKGFAVVAEEVGKLAEQSSNSVREISKIIHSIQKDSMESINKMDNVTRNVQEGLKVVNETGETFQKIISSVRSITKQISEVTAASKNISNNSEKVTATVREVSQIAVEFSESAQEVASASEEQLASIEEVSSLASLLNEKADELEKIIQKFKV